MIPARESFVIEVFFKCAKYKFGDTFVKGEKIISRPESEKLLFERFKKFNFRFSFKDSQRCFRLRSFDLFRIKMMEVRVQNRSFKLSNNGEIALCLFRTLCYY